MLGRGVGGAGEGLAAVDLEDREGSGCGRGEGEVAGVDGLAGVVEGGGVGDPVGEGGLGDGFVEAAKVTFQPAERSARL